MQNQSHRMALVAVFFIIAISSLGEPAASETEANMLGKRLILGCKWKTYTELVNFKTHAVNSDSAVTIQVTSNPTDVNNKGHLTVTLSEEPSFVFEEMRGSISEEGITAFYKFEESLHYFSVNRYTGIGKKGMITEGMPKFEYVGSCEIKDRAKF